jgi:hypothetical protein
VAMDVVSFYVTFMGNVDLFKFWYAHLFLILDSSYDGINKIDDISFTTFLLRMLSVLKICNSDSFDEYSHFIDEQVSSPLYRDIKNMESRWFDDSKRLIDELWDNSVLKAASQDMLASLNNMLKFVEFADEGLVQKIKTKIKDNGEAFLYRDFLELMPIKNIDEKYHQFLYVQHLFYTYLLIIMEDSTRDNCVTILKRKQENGQPYFEGDEANILFDPRGGAFISNLKARREYFQLRTIIVMSLWDCSMRNKLNYVKKYFE